MLVNRLLLILLALLFSIIGAQLFTVTSFDTAEVLEKDGWRALTLADIKKIKLSKDDLVKVSSGTLTICKLGKESDLRIAYPGLWSVGDIWQNKALPKYPNTSGPGDTEKGSNSLSIDFFKDDGKVGNSINEGDSLAGVVLTNHSNDVLFAVAFWADSSEEMTTLYLLPLGETAIDLKPQMLTTVLFDNLLKVDNNKNQSIVYIVYSDELFEIPSFDSSITETHFLEELSRKGLRYVTRSIIYLHGQD